MTHDKFPDDLEESFDIRYRFGAIFEIRKWILRTEIDNWCKENLTGTLYINVSSDPLTKFGLYYMPFLSFEKKEDHLKYILKWFGKVY